MSLRSFSHIISLLVVVSIACEAQQRQDLAIISSGAHEFLVQALSSNNPSGRFNVKLNALDQRLQLSHCDNPLTYELQNRRAHASNVTLKVRCLSPATPWSFYMTAKVEHIRSVLVASRTIIKGAAITADDFTSVDRVANGRSANVLTQPHQAIGKQAKRPIGQGESLTSSSLMAAMVIHKGDQVVVTAAAGGISVTTAGTAMTNGKVGQQIRVQNGKTDRIIKAQVVAAGYVEVSL